MKRWMAAAAAAAAMTGCNPQPAHAPAATASPAAAPTGAPPLNITGRGTRNNPVRIAAQNGNRKVYQLVTNSYTSHSAQNVTQAQFAHPTVTFYAKDGTKLTATAPSAGVHSGKQVVLTGGVHATTSKGLTLTCDTLTYDQTSEMLYGEGHVRITGEQGGAQQLLTGSHFKSDVKLTNMVIN